MKQFVGCVLMLGLAYACFQVNQRFILQAVQVSGTSMSPTLPDAACYVLNRFVYVFREPQPQEIVVLRDPQDDGYAIKRVIAKPGDSVFVKKGQLFVNGKLLKEPYLQQGTKTFPDPKYTAAFFICGKDRYFVLGDNRNNSTDSRAYGSVPKQNILGMVSP